jgi:hypothetical protein
VIPILNLGNPSNFADVMPDDAIRVEIMKESLLRKKMFSYVQDKYPEIIWVLIENVVAYGKNYGSYVIKDLETNL